MVKPCPSVCPSVAPPHLQHLPCLPPPGLVTTERADPPTSMTEEKPLKRSPSTPAREKPPWDPTCGRPGYYPKEAAPLHRIRVLASPNSTLKSPPCYGFSHEERPRPGAKQAWRLEMTMEQVANASPGPIYLPNVNSSLRTPPKFSVKSRVKPLAGTMNNPGPTAYKISTGLGVKLKDGRFATRPQWGFGTGTRDQANQLFLHPHARLSTRRPACLSACGSPLTAPVAYLPSFRHAGNTRATTAPPASCKPRPRGRNFDHPALKSVKNAREIQFSNFGL